MTICRSVANEVMNAHNKRSSNKFDNRAYDIDENDDDDLDDNDNDDNSDNDDNDASNVEE